LGHLVLHKSGAPQGREAENEANAFASAFLMPRGDVIANAPRFPTFRDLVKAKKRWKASVAALNHRMHIVGMLSDWQYRTLCIEIAKLGRDVEPEESQRESSQILPAVFSALYQDGITRSDVARELAVRVSDLEQMMFGLAMTGIEGGSRHSQRTPNTQSKLRLVEKRK
jgi:Zn-dependent peptidase ImmA (M78 family)